MSVASAKLPGRSRSLPGPALWTLEEFHRAKYSGFWEGRKILLIEGELIEMPNPGPVHNSALGLADYCFKAIFARGYWVRVQMPMVLGINTDPLPDLAVVAGDPRTVVANPETARLVLEVSDSTLSYDRGEKASLYAAAGIADYWVVDVVNRQVLVHRDPKLNATAKYGSSYSSVTALSPGQSIAPLAAPQRAVDAGELLP